VVRRGDTLSAKTWANMGVTLAPPVLVFRLYPVRPNPVDGRATIRCDLPAATTLEVRIVDAAGRMVRWLHQGPSQPGALALTWDGKDDSGRSVGSGIYFVKVRTGRSWNAARKVVVLRGRG